MTCVSGGTETGISTGILVKGKLSQAKLSQIRSTEQNRRCMVEVADKYGMKIGTVEAAITLLVLNISLCYMKYSGRWNYNCENRNS